MKKFFCLIILLLISSITFAQYKPIELETPSRPKGQTDVIELRAEPIPNVRIAIIGLGNRGVGAIYRLSKIPTATIVAICDIQPDYIDRAKKYLTSKVDTYTGSEDWKRICERDDIDLVYVCTHWDLHAPIGVYAMNHGKHVALEVPAALTIKECWDLVDTAEKKRKHCIMLENCNYDFFELMTLNMAQQGVFGEITHCEGAYIHDLREEIFYPNAYWKDWRLQHNIKNKGNLYPTHGLGPIAHIMNIHRGDRMKQLVCVATEQFGLTEYAKEKFGENSKEAKINYQHGDMSTTLIKTIKGKTLLIQHDVTSARPYSRKHVINGTKGFAQKYPIEELALSPNTHEFLSDEEKDSVYQKYTHPIVSEIGKKAKEIGGHGGMDFIMDYRLIYCLNNGLPLDMDVYDAVEWSCLVPLTRLSIENNNAPVIIPDFTRGSWNKKNTITYYTK